MGKEEKWWEDETEREEDELREERTRRWEGGRVGREQKSKQI